MKIASVFLLFVSLLSTVVVAAGADTPQVPSSVVWIYLFLQNPSSTARGSGKEVATMITPDDFRKNFTRYQAMARQEKMKLIITAETQDGQWIQDQIQYKGNKLHRAPYYNPGIDKVVPGAEIPLE